MYWDFDSRDADFNHDAEIEDINDGLDENIKEGSLSPITHKNLMREDVEDSSSEKKKSTLGNIPKAKAKTFAIDDISEPNIEINLEIEQDADEAHNETAFKQIVEGHKPEDVKQKQVEFEQKLKQKREESNSNSAGKMLQMSKPRTETGSAQSVKDNSSAGSKTGMKALS
jgi:hypothetical protein